MTRLRLMITLLLMLWVAPTFALANSCDARARQIAASMGNAEVLAVQTRADGNGGTVCVAKLRIPPQNGQPQRIVTRKFRL